MKINTSELEGAALDWAVAQSVGNKNVYILDGGVVYDEFIEQHGDYFPADYSPSTDWSQLGPLLEQTHCYPNRYMDECSDVVESRRFFVVTEIVDTVSVSTNILAEGPTPLIAACRAIVASKLGDTVDVPEELV